MMPRFVLDTNVLVAQLRGAPVAQAARDEVGLAAADAIVTVSVVTVGELYALAYKLGWGTKKRARLRELLAAVTVLDVTRALVERYAEIDGYSQGKHSSRPSAFSARNMGKNDLWIAATASLTKAKLVTTDKDFDHLDGGGVDVVWLDPHADRYGA